MTLAKTNRAIERAKAGNADYVPHLSIDHVRENLTESDHQATVDVDGTSLRHSWEDTFDQAGSYETWSGNTELSLELWTVIAGISGFDD